MPTAQVVLDTSRYVRVNEGYFRIMLQALNDAVRVVISAERPSKGNTSFHMLTGGDAPLMVDANDANVWALATTRNSSLIVTEIKNPLPVSTQTAFSAAGILGTSFARVIPLSLPAGAKYSVKIQKNSDVAIRFIAANGLHITAVRGVESGDIVALPDFISTNGFITSEFFGSMEVYDGPAIGDAVLGEQDRISESIYPDGTFVIELENLTTSVVNTYLTVGVQQISDPGVYLILQPDTLLEPTTEMSDYNGTN